MSGERPNDQTTKRPNVVLVIGEDDYLVSEAAKKVVGDGVGLEVFDSGDATNADAQLKVLRAVDESFMTPPFFDPKKTTWWKNVGFLPHQGKGAPSEEVKAALEKFAEKVAASVLPENQRFLITGPKLKMDSVFAKTLKGVAEVIEYKTGKPWEQQKNAVVRVLDLAAEMNLKFAPGVAEKFVSVVGCDSRSLMSELAKLREFLGKTSHTVDAAAVDAISSPGIVSEPEIWSVTDAVGARNLEAALGALRRFEQENGFAVIVSGALERLFRQLCELKDAAERNVFDQATEGMAPFTARKYQGFLRSWTLRELRLARKRFLELRDQAVQSTGSVETMVVAEIVRFCRRPRRA